MKLLLTFLSAVLFCFVVSAQAPGIEWNAPFGGSGIDQATSIEPTKDSGYIVAGGTSSNDGDVSGNHGGSDGWVIKLKKDNSVQWKYTYGGSGDEWINAIHQTADTGYIIAGYTTSSAISGYRGTTDFWVAKLDKNGLLVWQRALGGTAIDIANAIQQTSNGNYIIAGYSESNDGDLPVYGTGKDYWIVNLNSTGTVINWQKVLGGVSDDAANDIKQTPDGGYIVAGYSQSFDYDFPLNQGGLDIYVVKLDSTGIVVWKKNLGGSGDDVPRSIMPTNDGGYIMAAGTRSNNADVTGNHGGNDYWILKLRSTGSIQWQKTFGGTGYDQATSAKQTSDGGYIVSGVSESSIGQVTGNHGMGDYWILKLNGTGTLQWQKSLGGTLSDQSASIDTTADGGYMVAGYTYSNDGDVCKNHGSGDFWIAKLRGTKIPDQVSGQLISDKSFPTPILSPKGVAADGVARLYVKVKATSSLPIQKVEISIDNDGVNKDVNMLGKVMTATIINDYSEEANSATDKTTSANTSINGDFWFWYVAPDDFSESDVSTFANASERNVNLHIVATANDGSNTCANFPIIIVRPPFIMVHGLGGSARSTWNDFKYGGGTQFIASPLFKQKKAVDLDPSPTYLENAELLLNPLAKNGTNRLNTLQGNIEELRIQGYACNQVDYVCHSMGGCVMRTAMTIKRNKFYGLDNENYKNYQQGLIHKAITINTPHQGTPIADIITQITPLITNQRTPFFFEVKDVIKGLSNKLGSFVVKNNNTTSGFEATAAVKNLQVYDGIHLLQTSVKNHKISGDIDIVSLSNSNLPKLIKSGFAIFLETYCKVLRDNIDEPFRTELNNILDLNEVGAGFLEWYSQKTGFNNFLGNSDLIVPLKSQLAGAITNGGNSSILYNNPPETANAIHTEIVGRIDVGDGVVKLLNTPIQNSLFGDVIPATIKPPTQPVTISPRPVTTIFNKVKIKINSWFHRSLNSIGLNQDNSTITIGDTLSLQYELLDTSQLVYTDVSFQLSSKLSKSRTSIQNISIPVDSVSVGNQTVYVTAVYDKPTGVEYYIDTLIVNVTTNAALTGFTAQPDTISIQRNNFYYPDYTAIYNTYSVPVLSNNSDVIITIGNTSLLKLDTSLNAFTAIADTGSTYAIVNYKGLKDTIYFTITPTFYYGCINRTMASGNWNNAAIWDKGVVPGTCDSVVIMPGHDISFNSTIQLRALNISSGGKLTIADSSMILQIGEADDGNKYLVNNGTLDISKGKLIINGRLQQNTGSTFAMSGGQIIIDGNTGFPETSLSLGQHLFDVSNTMASFSFTSGTLQFIDPPLWDSSQTINCPYNFGPNSTVKFGDGVSTTASANPNGFGGNLLPAQFGKMVLDAATPTNNRIFKNLTPLTITSPCEVKSGNLVQGALLKIVP